MKTRRDCIYSLIFKVTAMICVIIGVCFSYFQSYAGGYKMLLYFTTQSNLWILIFDAVMLGVLSYCIIKDDYYIHPAYFKVQEVLVISIAITCFVFCFALAPGYYLSNGNGVPEGFKPFAIYSVMLHLLVPILSIVDFFLFSKDIQYKKTDALYALIPFGYYFIFSLIGYFLNWDFGHGKNYPYPFMNYGSPVGLFGFGGEMPYFMGSFYWGILIVGSVIGLSFLAIYLSNLRNRNKQVE